MGTLPATTARDGIFITLIVQALRRGELREERMPEGFTQRDPVRRVVLQHAPDDVKQLQVVGRLRQHVPVQRLTVIAHVPARGGLLVPVELAVVEVFGAGFSGHSIRNCT